MENKKYKVISMDLDGTLLTSDKKITSNTMSILKEYRDKGVYIIGITARNLSSIKNILDIKMFDYIIINNGAYIVDVNNNTINDLGCMDFEDAKKIDSLFSDKNAKVEYCTLNTYYKYYMLTNRNRSFEVKINQIEDVIEKIARINVILPSRQEINYYKKYIEDNFNSLSVVAMEDTDQKNSMLWLTITDKNTSKLIALSNLCEKLKINMKDVIFFGDGENDICLIKGAGLGIAMGNAIDLVKEQADRITLSNDEDGIYDFLKKIE